MTGNLGYETAYKLYKDNIVRIKKQFPQFFIKRFLEIGENMEDFDIEKSYPCVYSSEMRTGGLFGALWELCDEADAGCTVALERIPVRQEIIEILELFSENPYEVPSAGCRVLFCDGPLPGASLIGYTDNTKDRVIDCGTHKRFLTPPQRQAKDINNRKGEEP